MEKEETTYNLIDWWKKVMFRNYANFKGRARRAEYWYFTLGNFILLMPFYAIAIASADRDSSFLPTTVLWVYVLSAIASIIPSLAVTVRRLHDLNKSGWNYFVAFIPFIGSIILLVWLFTDGNRFINNYGNDPKNILPEAFDFEGKTG